MQFPDFPRSRIRGIFLSKLNQLKEESLLGYILAVFPRILFFVHAIFAIQFLKNITSEDEDVDSSTYRPLYTGIMLLIVELFYTILAKRGHENKHIWFSGFLYLVSLVPTIWLMELNFLHRRQISLYEKTQNITSAVEKKVTTSPSVRYWGCIQDIQVCDPQFVKNYTLLGLLGVIIIGRWMLPRGDLTRDQLSALLIGYLNIAADLTEFIGFHSKLKDMMYSRNVAVAVLSVYSVSLLQFIIVTTSTTYEYTEQEKMMIERLTKSTTGTNTPAYLQPHARKLRRASISRNIDRIAKKSFAAGTRSGGRRTAIASDPAGLQGSPSKRIKPARKKSTRSHTARAKVKEIPILLNGFSINNNVIGTVIEEEETETKADSLKTSARNKWISNRKVAQRLKRFHKSILQEDWSELSEAILEMKASESARDKDTRISDRMDGLMKPEEEESPKWNWRNLIEVAQSDTGAILIAMLFQECPFFVTRVILMYHYKTHNRGLIFYTIKNIFMLTFLSYKLWVSTIE